MFYMTTNYFRDNPHLFLGTQLGSGFIWNLLRPFSLDLGFASGCSSKLTFSSSGLGLLIMILQLTLRRYEGIVIRDKELIINEVRLTFFAKKIQMAKLLMNNHMIREEEMVILTFPGCPPPGSSSRQPPCLPSCTRRASSATGIPEEHLS